MKGLKLLTWLVEDKKAKCPQRIQNPLVLGILLLLSRNWKKKLHSRGARAARWLQRSPLLYGTPENAGRERAARLCGTQTPELSSALPLPDLGQGAPGLLWPGWEFSACFLLGTSNRMGFEVLLCRDSRAKGPRAPDASQSWGKGVCGGVNLLSRRKPPPPPLNFRGWTEVGETPLPPAPLGSRAARSPPAAGKLSHSPLSTCSPLDWRRIDLES